MTSQAPTIPAADQRPRNGTLYAAIVTLMLVSCGVQVVRDRGWQPYRPADSVLWVRSGTTLAKLSLGFRNILADIYWMRAVVYYGGNKRAGGDRPNYDLLYPLLDLVTGLDPHFRIAYRFGAIFLTESYPNGPGRPDLGMQLLQRGIERDFGLWTYYHDIAFIYYWWLNDLPNAAKWFALAADRPGSPEWLKPLAAVTLAEGGNRNSSRQLWTELRNSDVAYLRNNASMRLQQLDAMDAIDKLALAIGQFEKRTGRQPRNFQELAVAERLPREAFVDPTGKPFVVNPESGRLDVARDSTLWPLPVEPTARQTP